MHKKILILGILVLFSVFSACTTPPVDPVEPESQPTPTQANTTVPAETVELSSPTAVASPPADTPTPVETEEPSPSPGVVTPGGGGAASFAFTFLDMKDETNGWGLTETQVLRTEDGGSGWVDVTPGGLTSGFLPGAFFLDADQGWVIVPAQEDPEVGQLHHTSDGGAEWTAQDVPFGNAQLYFLDPLNGWALVGRGAGAGSHAVDIFRTQDGGENWELMFQTNPDGSGDPGALPFSGIKSGISFITVDQGWIGGSVPVDGMIYFYTTGDGGATWELQELILPAGYENAQTSSDAPIFFASQAGILPVRLFAETSAIVFYVTRDGGSEWTPGTPVENSGPSAVGSPMDFYVWGEAGLSVSHDGGATWTTLTPNVDLWEILAGLEFVGSSNGWALTVDAEGNRMLYRTTDGGETWTEVE